MKLRIQNLFHKNSLLMSLNKISNKLLRLLKNIKMKNNSFLIENKFNAIQI